MKSQNLNLELEEAERRENEINVNDKEMAERYVIYQSFVNTLYTERSMYINLRPGPFKEEWLSKASTL